MGRTPLHRMPIAAIAAAALTLPASAAAAPGDVYVADEGGEGCEAETL